MHWRQIASLPYQQYTLPTGRLSRATIAFPGGAPTRDLYYTPLSATEQDFSVEVLRMWPGAGR